MAVSIVSLPTTPNVTGTKLLFDITSSNINYPQYSYVMDVYESGSSELISRVLQTPNSDGAAVFDPSQIVYPLLSTENILNITVPTEAIVQFKTFDFKFGEAYATNISSSLTFYTNQSSGSVGVFNGTVNPNTGYNFPSQSYMPDFGPTPQGQRDAILTDAPYISTPTTIDNFLPIGVNDRHTYSILKQAGYTFPETVSPNFVAVTIDGKRVSEMDQTINSMEAYIDNVEIPQIEQGIIHIPSGPQNLLAASTTHYGPSSINLGLTVEEFFNSADWLYYDVNVRTRQGSLTLTMNQRYINETLVDFYSLIPISPFTSLTYSPIYEPTGKDKLVFAFANQYGALDYFNCYAPLRRSSTVDRNIVSLPKVDYSNSISTYSYEQRGDYEYHRDTNDSYVITTPLLDQYVANWVEQLLESPIVYVVQGQALVPIIITNASYTANTNENRQKVFTYDIEFRPSKGREINSQGVSALPNPSPGPGDCDFVPIISEAYDCG